DFHVTGVQTCALPISEGEEPGEDDAGGGVAADLSAALEEVDEDDGEETEGRGTGEGGERAEGTGEEEGEDDPGQGGVGDRVTDQIGRAAERRRESRLP